MQTRSKSVLVAVFGLVLIGFGSLAHADCEIIADGKKTPYDGRELPQNIMIEKKSMVKLDQAFPSLNVMEKIFKGEVVTCSNCSDNYLVCGN